MKGNVESGNDRGNLFVGYIDHDISFVNIDRIACVARQNKTFFIEDFEHGALCRNANA